MTNYVRTYIPQEGRNRGKRRRWRMMVIMVPSQGKVDRRMIDVDAAAADDDEKRMMMML